jgi:hypothetical protein
MGSRSDRANEAIERTEEGKSFMNNVDRETQAAAFWIRCEAYRPDHNYALERRGVKI